MSTYNPNDINRIKSTNHSGMPSINGLSELGFPLGSSAPNLDVGGLHTYVTKLHTLDASTPAVWNSVVPIVVHTPTFFDTISPRFSQFLKMMVETQTLRISGLDYSHSISTDNQQELNDSQTVPIPIKHTRSQPTPQMSIIEVAGSLVYKFFVDMWMKNIIDPDTGIALLDSYKQMSNIETPPLLSSISMAVLMIQFDITLKPENILHAPLYTCMYPINGGELGIEKLQGQSGNKIKTRDITFTAIVQENENIKNQAREFAEILSIHRIDPQYAPPGTFSGTLIDKALVDSGVKRLVSGAIDGIDSEYTNMPKYERVNGYTTT